MAHRISDGRQLFKSAAVPARLNRRTILEILRDTKPNLPGYWRAAGTDAVKAGG